MVQPWTWSNKGSVLMASIPGGTTYVEQFFAKVPEKRFGMLLERSNLCPKL